MLTVHWMYKEKLHWLIFEELVLDLIHGYTDSYLYLGTNINTSSKWLEMYREHNVVINPFCRGKGHWMMTSFISVSLIILFLTPVSLFAPKRFSSIILSKHLKVQLGPPICDTKSVTKKGTFSSCVLKVSWDPPLVKKNEHPPLSYEKVSVTRNVHFPIRAERCRREIKRCEHPKM